MGCPNSVNHCLNNAIMIAYLIWRNDILRSLLTGNNCKINMLSVDVPTPISPHVICNHMWLSLLVQCTRMLIHILHNFCVVQIASQLRYFSMCWSIIYERVVLSLLSDFMLSPSMHGDVIKWKHFPRHWPFVRLNKRLSKQWWGWWFETLSCPLWRHRNVNCIFSDYAGNRNYGFLDDRLWQVFFSVLTNMHLHHIV